MPWEIKGAAGAALNATNRTPEALGIDSWTLRLASLAMDTFSWTAATDGPTGAGTIIPTAGQVVEVFNAAGARCFKGHVAEPRVGLSSASVTVFGPWWWMERISLSGDLQDGTGATGERTSYVFPTNGLRISVENLIDRMIEKGVPITRGTVSNMGNRVKMTLSNMSFAAALAELLRWSPDSVAWFDYSGATPALNVTRRPNLTRLTLTVGSSNIERIDIAPRLDQEVKRVRLNYVERNPTNGKPKWASSAFGTVTTGKIQIVSVSGPEIADFLPRDDFESVVVRTASGPNPGNAYVRERAGNIASNTQAYGQAGQIISDVTGYVGTTWQTSKYGGVAFPTLRLRKKDGTAVATAGRYLLFTQDMPDWARKALKAVDVSITGTWGGVFSETATVARPPAVWQKWWDAAPQRGNMWANEYTKNGTPRTRKWWAYPFECEGILVNAQHVSNKTIYRPWDYDYLNPPGNMAESLQAAQDWIPWEGDIVVVDDDVSGENRLNRKLCVAGSYAAHADMDAPLRAVTYEGHRGRTIYSLGAPARLDYGSLVSRVRRDPQDNIVWL